MICQSIGETFGHGDASGFATLRLCKVALVKRTLDTNPSRHLVDVSLLERRDLTQPQSRIAAYLWPLSGVDESRNPVTSKALSTSPDDVARGPAIRFARPMDTGTPAG